MISDEISNASARIFQLLCDRPEAYKPFERDIDRLLQHMAQVQEKLDSDSPGQAEQR
ncbi:MAG: hypothetical protein KME13_23865 [Myxacorys californica WJT36-NPBG1]|jgi:hypothetical protein|nr:hypothetical protein [Myxacorys californica WJT36-NPBG1]